MLTLGARSVSALPQGEEKKIVLPREEIEMQ